MEHYHRYYEPPRRRTSSKRLAKQLSYPSQELALSLSVKDATNLSSSNNNYNSKKTSERLQVSSQEIEVGHGLVRAGIELGSIGQAGRSVDRIHNCVINDEISRVRSGSLGRRSLRWNDSKDNCRKCIRERSASAKNYEIKNKCSITNGESDVVRENDIGGKVSRRSESRTNICSFDLSRIDSTEDRGNKQMTNSTFPGGYFGDVAGRDDRHTDGQSHDKIQIECEKNVINRSSSKFFQLFRSTTRSIKPDKKLKITRKADIKTKVNENKPIKQVEEIPSKLSERKRFRVIFGSKKNCSNDLFERNLKETNTGDYIGGGNPSRNDRKVLDIKQCNIKKEEMVKEDILKIQNKVVAKLCDEEIISVIGDMILQSSIPAQNNYDIVMKDGNKLRCETINTPFYAPSSIKRSESYCCKSSERDIEYWGCKQNITHGTSYSCDNLDDSGNRSSLVDQTSRVPTLSFCLENHNGEKQGNVKNSSRLKKRQHSFSFLKLPFSRKKETDTINSSPAELFTISKKGLNDPRYELANEKVCKCSRKRTAKDCYPIYKSDGFPKPIMPIIKMEAMNSPSTLIDEKFNFLQSWGSISSSESWSSHLVPKHLPRISSDRSSSSADNVATKPTHSKLSSGGVSTHTAKQQANFNALVSGESEIFHFSKENCIQKKSGIEIKAPIALGEDEDSLINSKKHYYEHLTPTCTKDIFIRNNSNPDNTYNRLYNNIPISKENPHLINESNYSVVEVRKKEFICGSENESSVSMSPRTCTCIIPYNGQKCV